ncbi:MAG: tRNA pseudouridine38-40 synthase [Blastocatellia bacterium]|jgi:tRNA pseudouridine38-40 synthase|nr:tRNA pseudouridine38-40 synthase [Blastocatellia bacterium]
MNYRLTIQYDGSGFCGWQMQGALRTVQGELTRVLTLLDGREVLVHGAGRTDAGVHAAGQVASAQLEREFAPEKLRGAINGNLAGDVRVIEAEIVPDDFHARYSARGKTYLYRIFNEQFMSPFWSSYTHHEARPLSLEKMQRAAACFPGSHDWTAFSAAQSDVKTRVREITALEVTEVRSERGRGRLINIKASADGFLRYMVRSIAGALLAAGRGELDAADIAHMITSGERRAQAATAPARGLTLMRVHYD